MVVLLPRQEDGQSKEDEIGGARGTYGKKKFRMGFWNLNLKAGKPSEDLGVDEGIK